MGWNVGHLIAHVTASSEEGAAISSVLARGIDYPFEPRLRAEVAWETPTTIAASIQRLEESRRMRQGYLSTWPIAHASTRIGPCPRRSPTALGPLNAVGAYLLGLIDAAGQLAQLRDIITQTQATS